MGEEEGASDHDVSWAIVGKKRKIAAISTRNRFTPLQSNDVGDNGAPGESSAVNDVTMANESDEPKPPPFYLEGVGEVEGMIKKFTGLTGEKSFVYKCLSDGSVRVNASTIAAYRNLTKFLRDKKIAFHTYQIKSERSFDVVISGLHRSFKLDDLKYALKEEGHNVRSASVMQKKVYDINSETYVSVSLDKFIVHLEPSPNNKDIYKLNSIDHCIIKVEAPYKRMTNGVPPQCTNCLIRGHTRNYCFRPPRCVKCGEDHHYTKCKLPISAKPKCANCGEDHTANYQGCEDYQKRIQRRREVNHRQVQEFNIQQHNFAPLPGREQNQGHFDQSQSGGAPSYANVTKQDGFLKRIEELMIKQTETINTLMNMMSTLLSHLCRK